MSHFAKVVDGVVVNVIVAEQDYIDTLPEEETWIQTSYNTRGGVHYDQETGLSSDDQTQALRGNYAGRGFVYDSEHDAFYRPQPYSSWALNTTSFMWEPPVAYPTDGQKYNWNEESQTWDAVESE